MKLVDGKLVDIRQDSSHTLGMIYRRGKHAPEIIYSEHRLKYPMKRIGPKESYDFERITWDETYQTIVVALNSKRPDFRREPCLVGLYVRSGRVFRWHYQ
ncbi:MAG: molybdopterin-dependent oxidoreductase [Dehalococcoidales bacterium]|jgi:anaerobic selenocysteine-containing dehydrogenase|nr:molybdopterin-dependent oxidoreductase [Dehalococcoidales bacterium]